MRTLLIDGDITAFQFATTAEVATDWGNDQWSLHADEGMAKAHMGDHIITLQDTLEADAVVIALSSPHNFRYDVLPTYKHNRKETRKPMILSALRDHLRDCWDVWERDGLEGDDVLGILATSDKIVKGEKIVVSLDKDLKTIPCNLYRTSHPDEGIKVVTEWEADYWHLMQTLMGDTTDGYSGCPGVGKVAAEDTLSEPRLQVPVTHVLKSGPSKGETVTRWTKGEQCSQWEAIVSLYEKAGLTEDDALQQARVARILRASDYNFKKREPILWTPSSK